MTDMETGFKVFKSKCLKKIFLEEDRFGFELSLQLNLQNKNSNFTRLQFHIKVDHTKMEKNWTKRCL